MSVRKLMAISILVCAALSLLPLTANAAPVFFNVSGVVKGNATFTFTNMSSTGVAGKKVSRILKFANGVVNPNVDAGDVLVVDSAIFKAALGNPFLVVNYPGNTTVRFDTAGFTLLLNSSGKGASGIGRWFMQFPTDDFIESNVVSGTQYVMDGACRLSVAVNTNTGKGVIKASQMIPGEAFYRTFTSLGTGPGGVTYGDEIDTDAKATMPAMPLTFIEQP